MSASNVRSGRWPTPRRARVRVRLGRYVLVGHVARVAARAAGPPAITWRSVVVRGRVGYGAVRADGRVEYWRPLPALE
ncbi:MAG TPA: hypothetical protein VFF69_09455 [Phycisphaerales bacterium]|nr:hypothetical protein [Phycisphaerales bacterium]